MTTEPTALYDLVDPRSIAESAPYTFFLPNAAEMAAVGRGDLVKLTFEYPPPTEKWAAERMWVTVEQVGVEGIVGSLDNHPDEPTSKLKAGDLITFQRHHILAIMWDNPAAAPLPTDRRQYWERCIVDQCVLDGEEPVEFLWRDHPEPVSDGDRYPDSGWCIRGRAGDASLDELNARKKAYVALGAVLNRDDSWIAWIDAPVGTTLVRDFATGRYIEEN